MAEGGGSGEGKPYEWSQNDNEVNFKAPIGNTGKDKLKVKIETSFLTVAIAGTKIFEKELAGKLVVDESYWSIEDTSAGRTLVVTLYKKKAVKWGALTKEEEEEMPKASELDENFDVLQLEHNDDDPERVEEQEANEKKLEARYKKLKGERGINDEETLKTFFALFDNCIQLYRLNKLSDYLEEVVPVCRKRGTGDKYMLKAIQALAFVRWKQSKFREALPLFHEMEDLLGKGAALCENIAHTYNSLGNYEQAEEYFRQSLKFIEQESGMNRGNRGGVLLGLGLVRDRLGKHKEALPVCLKAYEFYKDRANGCPASLQAKAGISCAKLHAKLGNLPKAEEFIREAVEMYEVTCGETSPLTASAYHELGKCLWAQRKREDAQKALKRAYEIESMKDAWELVAILEIHNLLMDTHLKETTSIQREKFQDYIKITDYVIGRVRTLPQDGNAAVYYKAAAELRAWAGKYKEAKALFEEAIALFLVETSTDCSGLIKSCEDMVSFCDRNLAGTQDSPMDFDCSEVSSKPAKEPMQVDLEEIDPAAASTSGVVIEEIEDDDMSSTPAAASSSAAESQPASKLPPTLKPCEYRPATASDFASFQALCRELKCTPLLETDTAFSKHLSGPGEGLCWAALQGAWDLVGFALCGSDGIFGHVQQLVVSQNSLSWENRRNEGKEDEVRHELLSRVATAAQDRGLRRLSVAATAGSQEDAAFSRLGGGWGPDGHRHHAMAFAVASSSSAKAAPSQESAKSQAKTPSELRRDGKDVSQYYNAWDKVNVEKTLIQEDGGDPSIVPERRAPSAVEEFGVEPGKLDISRKLSKYSWDQSDKFVTLYVNCEGAGKLPENDIKLILRPRGFLLIITQGGVDRWLKIPNLCKPIDTEASTKKMKSDMVVVKLKKSTLAETWSDVTDEKDEYQKRREYRINHGDLKGATTEELLADMYKNATDEERSGLRDAMKVNREKREEDARQKK